MKRYALLHLSSVGENGFRDCGEAPNKRLKLAPRVLNEMNPSFSAPQLKRNPLGGGLPQRWREYSEGGFDAIFRVRPFSLGRSVGLRRQAPYRARRSARGRAGQGRPSQFRFWPGNLGGWSARNLPRSLAEARSEDDRIG